MTQVTSGPARWLVTLSALCALSACEIKQQRSDAEPEPQATETAEPEGEAVPTGVSILRPEVDQPAPIDPTQLDPLETVVSFARGGDDLDRAAQSVLDTLLATPHMKASGKIILRGHSDSGAETGDAMAESEARAEAVRDYLVSKGANESRFSIIAFGSQNPLEPNAKPDGTPNEVGRAANRRVEIRVEPPKRTPKPSATADAVEASG